jgi:transitional endoplasmic reticulum ATPase
MIIPNRAHKRRKVPANDPLIISDELLRLWILRIMVPLNGSRRFLGKECFDNEAIAEFLELEIPDDFMDEFNPSSIIASLRQKYQAAEAEKISWTTIKELRLNSERLAVLMGLNETERRLLEFAIILHSHRLLDQAADYLGGLSNHLMFHVLAVLLDLPLDEVKPALATQGRLATAGLLTVDGNSGCCLNGKLDLLSDHFVVQMMTEMNDPAQLLRGMLTLSAPPTLTLEDYPHISRSLEVMRPYLKAATEQKRKGVNIFLYGPAGTGKSELVRVLAKEMAQELFEVASDDNNGDPVNGEKRLRSYRAAQSFLSHRPTFIMFDEVEDVFNDGNDFWGKKSTAQCRKAWMNQMLETNQVPTVWLSNTVYGLDRAFLRRFDMVLELPVPPKSQRERIVRASAGDFLNETTISQLANADGLTPAVITRAASVIRLIKDQLPADRLSTAMSHLVSNTMQAQGWGALSEGAIESRPSFYDPRFINTSADLLALSERALKNPRGSLCLYGPSGTGKTAFGRWLADKLGRPLLVKRASDLLGAYLGQTEQNIAASFREAQDSNAVLLIDEVDSFLQDRRRAQRSWEVSQVNEMLTQMESFAGVFIASTNLMGDLDQATLRRFDVKLRFDYLRPEQAKQMLICQCADLGLIPPNKQQLMLVAKMSVLTLGDFAVVRRQARLCGLTNVDELIAVLKEECALKEDGQKRGIGFV